MLKNLSDNLNLLMARERLNSNELARIINIPATTIKRIRSNDQANPTISTLLPIAKYFSITLNQLVGHEPLNSSEGKKDTLVHKIPLCSLQHCLAYSLFNISDETKFVLTERNMSAKAFAVLIEDNELEVFPSRSIVIVEPEIKPKTGDYVVIGNIKQKISCIRKYIVEIDQIYLKPLIQGVEISIFTPDYIVLGVIIQYKVNLL